MKKHSDTFDKVQNTLSIIIVNFHTESLVESCVTSIARHMPPSLAVEIIVVDNESTPESIRALRAIASSVDIRITCIAVPTNIGFGAANNRGIQSSHGSIMLFLNSDTVVGSDALHACATYLESHADVGVVTCKVLLQNGSIDPACHRGFPTPWAALTYFSGLEKAFPQSRLFSQYHLGYLDLATTHEIDSPTGAFFMVRKEVIDQVGGFDEQFFMYGEDLDLAYRIQQKGWKILYHPTTSITHLKKQSGRVHSDRVLRQKTQEYFYSTMQLFYKKHYEKMYPFIVTHSIYALLGLRIFLLRVFSV